jgi:proteasome lid subunit RPN8/RPN11
MIRCDYRHTAHFLDSAGQVIARAPIEPDWVPAVEWTRFEGLRLGTLPAEDLGKEITITPQWSPGLGRPFLAGFRCRIVSSSGPVLECDFPISHFNQAGTNAAQSLLKSGALALGGSIAFHVSAQPHRGAEEASQFDPVGYEEVAPHLMVEERALSQSLDLAHAEVSPAEGGIPVLIDEDVIQVAESLVAEASPNEMAGLLLGHLNREPRRPILWLHVTAVIPAQHTVASSAHVTFTAETWSALREASQLRGRGEMAVGWVHSHPVRAWCSECPPEKKAVCIKAERFFSAQDQMLHRTVFPKAHSVALVATDTVSGIRWDLYGWKCGLIGKLRHHTVESVQVSR